MLITVACILLLFLGAAGFALDQAFRNSAREALAARLEAHIYTLLTAADVDGNGSLQLPSDLPDARFSQPGSGLYARLSRSDNSIQWQSASLLGMSLPNGLTTVPGEALFQDVEVDGQGLFLANFAVDWEEESGDEVRYIFSVAESGRGYQAEVAAFRTSLWSWLGGIALALLLTLWAVVAWGLRPLSRIAEDLTAIEEGRRERLSGEYPQELQGLTHNLNALIAREHARIQRYRHALGDLAHSLKTPLAVLRGLPDAQDSREEIHTQVDRMDQIIAYQLQRAATAGSGSLAMSLPLAESVLRLLKTLDKVYARKGIEAEADIADELRCFAEEGDLLEILGNILENAYKFADRRVKISAVEQAEYLLILVEDDGPGIEPERRDSVLNRGVRVDSQVEGQGIGLAVAHDILKAYGGALEIGDSTLGGAGMSLKLPRP